MVTMKSVLMKLGTSVVPVKVAIANLSMTQDAQVINRDSADKRIILMTLFTY